MSRNVALMLVLGLFCFASPTLEAVAAGETDALPAVHATTAAPLADALTDDSSDGSCDLFESFDDNGATQLGCGSDSDCAGYGKCSGGKCGNCGSDSDCHGHGKCSSGRCGNCGSDSDCKEGKCSGGKCGSCGSDSDCRGYGKCSGGKCGNCGSDSDCSVGKCSSGKCGACGSDSDCKGGRCSSGRCSNAR